MANRSGKGDSLAALLAVAGAVAVIGGAYGSHGATGTAAEWLKTGAIYLMIHAVAGLVAIQAGRRGPAGLFLLGGAVFSGTLFAMAFGAPRMLGAVTPLGGLAMILGWVWLAIAMLRRR
ncbi:DUF423 domain-containing protein [Sphingomonas montanisoli]|uniref:DUF423 domain-containing protein n=1 Tax=Sphingomonas montanisoli TaxID=2606412 RepID=A0A5D9CAV8_9SPHN|nr:DUF423 domain-containing protein [Sphingomonas montanisoli]TZG29078.1 DUF423 domain-containing protein [Sphingomonas montanisoli]